MVASNSTIFGRCPHIGRRANRIGVALISSAVTRTVFVLRMRKASTNRRTPRRLFGFVAADYQHLGWESHLAVGKELFHSVSDFIRNLSALFLRQFRELAS